MSKKTKNVIITVCLIVVLAVIGVVIYSFWPAIKSTIDDSRYYTQEEVQEIYDDGYKTALNDKEQLTEEVDYYKNLVDEYLKEIADKDREISELEKNLEDQEELKSQIESLKQEKEDLSNRLSEYINENFELHSTVSELESEIVSLNNEILRLNALINIQDEVDGCSLVEIMDGEVLVKCEYVLNGESLTELPNETKEGYTFMGYSFSDTETEELLTSEDVLTLTISEKTTLYMIYEFTITFNFYVDDELYHTQDVITDGTFASFENPVTEEGLFGRWYYYYAEFSMIDDGKVKRILDLSQPVPYVTESWMVQDFDVEVYWETYRKIEGDSVDVTSSPILFTNESLTLANIDKVIDFEIEFTYEFTEIDPKTGSYTFKMSDFTRVDGNSGQRYHYFSSPNIGEKMVNLNIYYDVDGQWEFVLVGGAGLKPAILSLSVNYISMLI